MAGYAYPPSPLSISGDVETINRFLQSPTLVARRLRTLVEQRFIGDFLLQGRATPAGGAIVYEQTESIYTDRAVGSVSPGSEYPITTVSTGPAQVAKVTKYGQDTMVTDEAIARMGFSPVDRALLKLGNTLVKAADATVLALIASAVTQTRAATVAWSTAGAPGVTGSSFILRDVLKAKATILALNQGYSPDVLVVDDITYAYVASDPTVVQAAQRERLTPRSTRVTSRSSVVCVFCRPRTCPPRVRGSSTPRCSVVSRTRLSAAVTSPPAWASSPRPCARTRKTSSAFVPVVCSCPTSRSRTPPSRSPASDRGCLSHSKGGGCGCRQRTPVTS
jgi:hypothetical protein